MEKVEFRDGQQLTDKQVASIRANSPAGVGALIGAMIEHGGGTVVGAFLGSLFGYCGDAVLGEKATTTVYKNRRGIAHVQVRP